MNFVKDLYAEMEKVLQVAKNQQSEIVDYFTQRGYTPKEVFTLEQLDRQVETLDRIDSDMTEKYFQTSYFIGMVRRQQAELARLMD